MWTIRLNHFFIHLLNILLKETLYHLPLEFEGCSDQAGLRSPGLGHESHHFGDFKLLKIGFNSMHIYAFDNSLEWWTLIIPVAVSLSLDLPEWYRCPCTIRYNPSMFSPAPTRASLEHFLLAPSLPLYMAGNSVLIMQVVNLTNSLSPDKSLRRHRYSPPEDESSAGTPPYPDWRTRQAVASPGPSYDQWSAAFRPRTTPRRHQS